MKTTKKEEIRIMISITSFNLATIRHQVRRDPAGEVKFWRDQIREKEEKRLIFIYKVILNQIVIGHSKRGKFFWRKIKI